MDFHWQDNQTIEIMYLNIPSIILTTLSGKLQILHEGNTMPRTFGRKWTAEINRIQWKVFFITPLEEELEKTLFYRKPQQEEDEEEESDAESVENIKPQKKPQQEEQSDTESTRTLRPVITKMLCRVLGMRKLCPSIDSTIHPPAGNTTMRKITRKLSNYFWKR